jgi:hypothetical protein
LHSFQKKSVKIANIDFARCQWQDDEMLVPAAEVWKKPMSVGVITCPQFNCVVKPLP